MSAKERRRLEVLSRVTEGELSLAKAAELLELSYRQVKRVYARYRREGDAGLVHGLRGRPSNHGLNQVAFERAMAAFDARYADFGPTLAAEYLQRESGLAVSAETLRRWLIRSGRWEVRSSRRAHRRWRARKEHRGEMVQMDGSEHDWFEGRGPRAVLMVMVDDATNDTYARFFSAETTAAVMETFQGYAHGQGLPQSLYVDRGSIYHTTRSASVDEQLAASPPLTQFGRAMQELGVRIILAHSPQAKGRVERRHGVFQDRLIKALRLRGIHDVPTANAFLEQEFLPELNERFSVAPAQPADLHRPLEPGLDLARILSFQERRRVNNDWTLRWRNRFIQLLASDQSLALVGQRVLVCEHLDGTVQLFYGERCLAWQELPQQPTKPMPVPRPTLPIEPWVPPPDHPWRRRALPRRDQQAVRP